IASRAGWGHSTPGQAVDLAAEAGCRRLVLFHHDPENDDDAVDALVRDARACAALRSPGLEVEAASEGRRLSL
ncbi:MAG: MBL fold metallo-hydrolase, partial [Deltaproteobacteria bacterium]